MQKLIFTFLLCLASIPAFAQAEATIGVHGVVNNPNGITNQANADKLGVNFSLAYRVPKTKAEGLTFTGRTFGSDGLPARSDYSIGYQVFQSKGLSLTPEGFLFRIGNDDGGGGGLGVRYQAWHALAQFGSDQYVRGQVAFELAKFGEHIALEPFGDYVRYQIPNTGMNWRTFTIGFRARVK